MNCDADAMNVGYAYVQQCQTQFHMGLQTVTYTWAYVLTFPPANFLLFNCDLSIIYNTR